MVNCAGDWAAHALALIKSGAQVFGLHEIIDRWHPQRKLYVFTVSSNGLVHQIIWLFQMNRAIMDIGEPVCYPYTGASLLYQSLFHNGLVALRV